MYVIKHHNTFQSDMPSHFTDLEFAWIQTIGGFALYPDLDDIRLSDLKFINRSTQRTVPSPTVKQISHVTKGKVILH